MDLILWRHAEAEPGEPDLGRRLTAKGVQQAERMAKWLDRHLPATTRILSSPADRAQQTALALKRKFRVVPELAPGASAAAVLAAAGWPDAREPVLIVGHQPTLGEVAAFLLTDDEASWSVRKGAVWWLSNRVRDGVVVDRDQGRHRTRFRLTRQQGIGRHGGLRRCTSTLRQRQCRYRACDHPCNVLQLVSKRCP